MNRSLSIIFLILSCAYAVYAQDSFLNPYSFTYEIEYSTEFEDSVISPAMAKLEVKYDIDRKASTCSLSYNGEQRYLGRVLDMRLEKDRQTFVLENYFQNRYNACLLVAREGGENSDIKIGMIYYANQKEDSASEKTCFCLLLKDVDTKKTIKF